jgi:hypothetical protein
MKKKILITCLIIASLAVASSASAKFYKECPLLFKLTEWSYQKIAGGGEYWVRSQDWFGPGRIVTGTGDGIFLDQKHKSHSIKSDPKSSAVLVYIGPWQKVTLTKGFLWNKETIETEIRMIASQKGIFLENHYETKDSENAKIPEQEFIPLEEPDDLVVKCDILRAQKWGYDSVLDAHVNVFRAALGKSVLASSGKIINAYTKEIIADEKGNLIKPKQSEAVE